MAMRRPRIKAQANIQLNAKRKPKTVDTKPKTSESDHSLVTVEDVPAEQSGEQESAPVEEEKHQQQFKVSSDDVDEDIAEKKVISSVNINAVDTNARSENHAKNATNNLPSDNSDATQKGRVAAAEAKNSLKAGNEQKNAVLNDTEPFKCPPKVEYQRSVSHTSNSGADDVFYSDIEENAMQLDLQRSPNGYPMSPSRNQTRQRIKATPIFGQRRNSFVGSSPNPHTSGGGDDYQPTNNGNNDTVVHTQRRERHISASLSVNSNSSSSHHQYAPHKYLPNGVATGGGGRMRTESGCSVFSDTNANIHKSRKTEDHKQSLKREFEARFVNGVPDKSCLKMSDLIYYNPVTNPMEQKPNPNIKHENSDSKAATSSSEVKPFKEKTEKDDEAMPVNDESEAMPVPQLKLDSNGELILDDKSLVIETTAEQEARKVLANSSLIYLDENTGMNGFYSRQKRTREWQSSETVKFYRCLQTVGTDFSLMVPLFPNRTRRDLKLKFKKEERINGNLINKALLYPKQFNIEDLKQQIDEEEKLREDEAARLKQLKEAAAKEVKKRKFVRSSADCTLKGSNVYHNENEQKVKRPRNSTTKSRRAEAAKATAKLINEATEPCTGVTENNDIVDVAAVEEEIREPEPDKIKRRRRRMPNFIQKDMTAMPDTNEPEPQTIKVEMVKNEPALMQTKTEAEILDFQHNDNLLVEVEVEIEELTHSDSLDINNISDNNMQPTVPITESPFSSESSTYLLEGDGFFDDSEVIDDDDIYESRTFVNLDDGSVTTVNDINNSAVNCPQTQQDQPVISQPTPSPSPSPSPPSSLHTLSHHHYPESPPSPTALPTPSTYGSQPDLTNNDTCSSQMSERELNERDIQQILTELAEGSLFLVSTLDPDDPDKVLNEIFMIDKNTGVLCDEPLNIPDNIVQCILSVMS